MRRITRILFSLGHGHLDRGLHGRDARATSRDIKGKARSYLVLNSHLVLAMARRTAFADQPLQGSPDRTCQRQVTNFVKEH
jgi:hypothetical protein